MIPFDFEYHKPQNIAQAVSLYQELKSQGRNVLYYSGGTEIITLGRLNQVYADAVIDIKEIYECNIAKIEDGKLVFGSALTLAEIKNKNMFPALTKTIGEVADHTVRNKITLGGNICSQIIYREGVLPLLLADAEVVLAGPGGQRKVYLSEVFNGSLQAKAGEFLIQVIVDQQWATYPYRSVKRRKQGNIGYPLMTIVAMNASNNQIRLAISGLCSYPFRCLEMEMAINNQAAPLDERINDAMATIPDIIIDDVEGSAEYRQFVLYKTLEDILMSLEGEVNV
ncbi:FAD binding domain-containing protein [Desulfuribacillus alkaliarsenatis]|uniref:Xanthine dehydrogenase n=1 Tax=Desulfuribacillus alkaliarsenatis TaxID=766136 RepID=A0A1E5G0E2_9FIRM|nr:FAD binding domain-containing protein [Desulfuribacillus alkaliarsenatis]OEF96301.1 xanthine dehydrogenase [Desulfuribacillus alkaliarsenatis]